MEEVDTAMELRAHWKEEFDSECEWLPLYLKSLTITTLSSIVLLPCII